MHTASTARSHRTHRPVRDDLAIQGSWDSVGPALTFQDWTARVAGIWWTRNRGKAAIEAAAKARLDALVRFARAHSPFYREAYRQLPDHDLGLRQLPVMARHALMEHFDDWATDRDIRRDGVEAFLADRAHIGWRYLGRYVVWKSSGTTGEPGIYLQDRTALATYDGLVASPLASPVLFVRSILGSFTMRGRAALVAATGDHFASVASWQRVCHANPWLDARGFSVMLPLPELVAQLNDYQPAFLASYPTALSLLAEEAAADRLRIEPSILWSGGEYLSAAAQRQIERTFESPMINEYGASECLSIAVGCRHGWLHVNADWALLEPVDAQYKPVPPGETSATVLVTNLANWVQPIIRYDLGDSVVVSPEACPCGSPLPAIRVEGRRDDVVSLRGRDGQIVRLLPLALTTVMEEVLYAHRFQIVQTGAEELSIRLAIGPGSTRRAAWSTVAGAMRAYLRRQSLPNVRLALDAEVPVTDQRSGKLRQVIVAPQQPSPNRGSVH
jgi:putative adenylate-forming enzyme